MGAEPRRFDREKKTIEAMIRIYCRDTHQPPNALCTECAGLLEYALLRLDKCAFGAKKPKCADCPIHCYKPARREAIQKVMRYAGPRMIVRHPLLALGHTLDGVRHRPVRTRK
jgi:hypothetical protein